MPRRSQSPINRKYEPAPQVSQQAHVSVQRPSMLQTMKEGLAFGVGNAIAHRVIMGSSLQQQKQEPAQQLNLNPEYIQCVKEYNDKAVCEAMYLKK